MGSEPKAKVLDSLTTRTKAIGLVTLILEVTFLASINFLPVDQVFWALLIIAVVFIVVVVGLLWVEREEIRSKVIISPRQIEASPLTPKSPLLNSLIQGAIQTVCRSVTVPKTPEEAEMRAFIFKVETNALICTHYWAPESLKVKEEVGLTFPLNRDLADKVAVLKAYYDKVPSRTPVSPLPDDIKGISGKIDEKLNFVLAAPIHNRNDNHSVWGVVDFDTSNDVGKALLSTSISDNVMFHLAEHLRILFSLGEPIQKRKNAKD